MQPDGSVAKQSLLEDLKDASADILAPEYHRLNLRGQRQILASSELFLSAVAASFLVPYVKRIAEKAADASWNKLVQSVGKTHGYQQLKTQIPAEVEKTVAQARPDEHASALAAAEVSLDIFLDQHGIPREIRARTAHKMSSTLERYPSSRG